MHRVIGGLPRRRYPGPADRFVIDLTDWRASLDVMTVWLLCDDPELCDVVARVAEQVRLSVRHTDVQAVKRELRDEPAPEGLLTTDDVLADGDLRALLGSVPRIILASGRERDERSEAIRATPLRLPTSLARLEAALRWLGGEGSGSYSVDSESSCANA
jgi:hypothetical protein